VFLNKIENRAIQTSLDIDAKDMASSFSTDENKQKKPNNLSPSSQSVVLTPAVSART
jgi:hypothetical protein